MSCHCVSRMALSIVGRRALPAAPQPPQPAAAAESLRIAERQACRRPGWRRFLGQGREHEGSGRRGVSRTHSEVGWEQLFGSLLPCPPRPRRPCTAKSAPVPHAPRPNCPPDTTSRPACSAQMDPLPCRGGDPGKKEGRPGSARQLVCQQVCSKCSAAQGEVPAAGCRLPRSHRRGCCRHASSCLPWH